MKKVVIFIIMVIIIVAIISCRYVAYKVDNVSIMKANSEYEQYKDKEVYGVDIATLINKSVDKNTKNKIEKDENGMFIQNDNNSIEIEIYMIDNEKTYKMESIYNEGTEKFVQHYGKIKFKCSKIEYHEKTKKVKYIRFEQLQTS